MQNKHHEASNEQQQQTDVHQDFVVDEDISSETNTTLEEDTLDTSVIISPQNLELAKQYTQFSEEDLAKMDEEGIKNSLLSAIQLIKVLFNVIEKKQDIKLTDDKSQEVIALLRDKSARLAAEVENTRIRITKSMEEKVKFASGEILKDLIPTIENLEAAIAYKPKEVTSPDVNNFIIGVELTLKKLLETLANHNISQVGEVGETFDPNIHEAVAQIDTDAPADQIVEVHRKGYRLHKRIITPAKVVVAKSKE